jgi:polar amino acid transport system substrate-binding protein
VRALDGDAAAGYLVKKGAQPERVQILKPWDGLIAAPDWQLQGWGFAQSQFELATKQHVMAVPPGENGWIKRVEDFLYQHRADIAPLLNRQELDR